MGIYIQRFIQFSDHTTEVAMIAGKLEITMKINELPQSNIVENGWQQFEIDCDGRIISIIVKPKIWKKLTDAASNSITTSGEASTMLNSVSKQTTGSCWRNPIYKFSSASPRQKRPLPSVLLLEKVITQSG